MLHVAYVPILIFMILMCNVALLVSSLITNLVLAYYFANCLDSIKLF